MGAIRVLGYVYVYNVFLKIIHLNYIKYSKLRKKKKKTRTAASEL